MLWSINWPIVSISYQLTDITCAFLWLILLLSMVFSRFTHIVPCIIHYSFLLSNNIIVHGMDIQYCIYKFRFSHSLAIMDNAILCKAFWSYFFLILFATYSAAESQDYMVILRLIYWGKNKLFSKVFLQVTSPPGILRCPTSLHSHHHLLLCLFHYSHLTGQDELSQRSFDFLFSND